MNNIFDRMVSGSNGSPIAGEGRDSETDLPAACRETGYTTLKIADARLVAIDARLHRANHANLVDHSGLDEATAPRLRCHIRRALRTSKDYLKVFLKPDS